MAGSGSCAHRPAGIWATLPRPAPPWKPRRAFRPLTPLAEVRPGQRLPWRWAPGGGPLHLPPPRRGGPLSDGTIAEGGGRPGQASGITALATRGCTADPCGAAASCGVLWPGPTTWSGWGIRRRPCWKTADQAFNLGAGALDYRLNLAVLYADLGRSDGGVFPLLSPCAEAVPADFDLQRFVDIFTAVGDEERGAAYRRRLVQTTLIRRDG